MKKSKILIIALILVLSMALGACNDEVPTTAVTDTGVPTSTASTSQTSSLPTTTMPTTAPTTVIPGQTSAAPATTAFNPLNGLTLFNPVRAGTRPVAIMISNIKIATPQLGINSADLYYELVVEGGITRMMVLFADPKTVPEIGSVRSVRSDYIDLAGGHDAFLVHAGGSTYAMDQINRQKTAHIDMQEYEAAFWRDAEWRRVRGYEHSVRTNGARLSDAIIALGIRSTMNDPKQTAFGFLPYGEVQPAADPTVNPAQIVTVDFSNYNTSTFKYDAQTKLYSKSEFGKPQIDLADNKPIQVTNVVVLRTTIKNIANTILMDANLTSGKGFYVSNGARLPILWRKGATNDPLVLTKEDGTPLLINRGKTYVCIQATSRILKFS